MVSLALKHNYTSSGMSAALGSLVDGALSTTKADVIYKLLHRKLGVADTKHIDSLISSQHCGPNDVEAQIKEARLRDAKRRKMELESKLEAVKESLNEFGDPAPKEGQAKLSLQNSRLRKQYMTDEQRKAQETAEFARKLREDQTERERRRKQKETEMHHKIKQELNDIEQLKRLREEEEEAKKQRCLAEMRVRAEARQEKSEQLRRAEQDYRKLMANKPLYQKIEESYSTGRIIPELERRKELLAKKRQGFRPMNKEELDEHARHLQEMRQELELRRARGKSEHILDDRVASSTQHLTSKFTYTVIQQDNALKRAQSVEQQEKKRLAAKKKQYASIVKEMFTPTVDSLKQKEMELVKERLKNPVKSLPRRSNSSVLRDNAMVELIDGTSASPDISSSRRRFKKNTMIPEERAKLEPKHVDYLGDRRKVRENYAYNGASVKGGDWKELDDESMDPEAKTQILKRKAQRAENEVKRHKLMLSSVHPDDINGLEAVDKVNDMLIGSIRAKLSMLDQIAR
jgi:hypothetical protein